MKILQLIQKQQLRGAEIFAAQLSEELFLMGNEVLLVSIFEGNQKLPFSGKHVCINAEASKRLFDRKSWKKLANLIAEFQPDIVQANAGDTLKYAAFSRIFFGWKAKLVFRNANLISGFITNQSKKVFNQFLLRQVAGIASVSAICADDFIQTFSFPEDKVSVLPIGVLKEKLVSSLPNDISELLDGSEFLIHVGSFVPEKNHKDLFIIFDQVLLAYPNLKLLLLGEGPLKAQYQKQLADRPEIVFLGSRLDVDSILPFAKGLLLPSLIEGLPGVILEAMNNNVPVVSYGVGGIPELVIPEKTGWLVPVGESEKFVNAVSQILSMNDKTKSRVTENAKKVVLQQYQIPIIAKKFESFYSKILANSI
ncbi:glycosyltransferase family 4 protein [uncultured Algoriphagus sp.]|uniref:glycosyltransferase family 4 protein n=1 Tax=uncultured Algoriphagus sp. TaxID=417365 RepID=UPI0030EEA455